MDDPIGASESLEEIARVAQIGNPAWAQLLTWRNFVEAKNLVAVRKQLPNNKLPQSTAAARNDDFFHLICSFSFLAYSCIFARDTPSFILPRTRLCRNSLIFVLTV